jgi:acetyltransferase-like isoleucine patch superfamily enzyme
MIANLLVRLARSTSSNRLRTGLYRRAGYRIGDGSAIQKGAVLGRDVTIGRNSIISSGCVISNATIGDNVRVKRNVTINNAEIGDRTLIQIGTIIAGFKENPIIIGKGVAIGYYWVLDGMGGLVVEDNVNIGSQGGGIFTHSGLRNRILGRSYDNDDELEKKPVLIQTCSWIGGKVTIQPGVTVGHHSAVMPNSSVVKDVDPFTMIGGVPAKPIKRIKISGEDVSFEKVY